MKTTENQLNEMVNVQVSPAMAEFIEMLNDKDFEIPGEIITAISDVTHLLLLHKDQMEKENQSKIYRALTSLAHFKEELIKI